jgi:UDP-glucose:(heptosyl)LPS alpha-1,3-glucosyltransferase
MVRKVAIIIERADAARGGAERSIFEVAEALSALGVQVDVLAAKGVAGPNVQLLCEHIPGKRVSLAAFAQALKEHLARADYDIVHSVLPFEFVDFYQPRGGTYAESMCRNVVTYRSPIARFYKTITACANRRRAELLAAERKLCRGAQGPKIAALSRYVAAQFQEHYATDPARIVLTLNGVKLDPPVDAAVVSKLRGQLLDGLGVAEDAGPVLFLFAAHNFRLKGLDRLIEALRMVHEAPTERPAHVIVVGAGTGRSRHLARRLGVDQHLLFLGAVKDLRNILALSDVGILPTYCDASSRFILEALAAGKPVITTRFNGATDHFIDGRHGKVVDAPDDIPALAEAIRHFTSTANLDAAARAIRQDDLARRISIERVARDLLGVYDAVLERKGRR